MHYSDEVAKYTTKQAAGSIKPSVLRAATSVELRHGSDVVTVAIERVRDGGCVKERLRFRGPGCGATVRTVGWAYGRWGCRRGQCLGWRTRPRQPIVSAMAPHVQGVVATKTEPRPGALAMADG